VKLHALLTQALAPELISVWHM